jgi:opacity protein-like surface antigen
MNPILPSIKTWSSIAACFFMAGIARADFSKGDQTIALFGGGGGSWDLYDLKGPDKAPVTGGGGAFGGQYLYYLSGTPAIAVGIDGTESMNGTDRSNVLIEHTNTSASMKSTVVMAIARLSFPRGVCRPYIFTGLGGHSSSLFLSGKPYGGQTWSDGGTDSRVIVDQHRTSVALGYGVGMDFFPAENFFFGVEVRGVWLANLNREITAQGSASGISSDSDYDGAVTQGNILGRLGWRFGK